VGVLVLYNPHQPVLPRRAAGLAQGLQLLWYRGTRHAGLPGTREPRRRWGTPEWGSWDYKPARARCGDSFKLIKK
jgi:hypothetical protein